MAEKPPDIRHMERKLAEAIDKMPAFPKSVQKVLALAADINCVPADLVDVIRHDPIFTLKVLKVVNSPFVGLMQKISSINQASVYLGVNTLKNLALGLACIGSLPRRNKAGFDMEAFWMHSLGVAVAARMLGRQLDLPLAEREDIFSAGLLHDVGKAVFALYLPEEYKKVLSELKGSEKASLLAAENRALGVTHSDMGAQLALKWELPQTLRDNIAKHHSLDNAPHHTLCVQAADLAVKYMGHQYAPEPVPEHAPAVEEAFGKSLPDIVKEMDEFQDKFEKARVFIEA